VLSYLFWIISVTGTLAGLYCLAAAGFRNGDRPGDARVTALLTELGTEDGMRPLVVATVRNPSGTPVLAALRVRRALLPCWLAGPYEVSAPRLTAGRRFRPGRFATVGVVAAAGAGELAVPVPPHARRCLLIVAVGQEGGRLREHRLRLGPVCYTSAGRDDLIMVT
jgi:hypothetical protein